jgi:bifunctional ADP-heptose synthase (sugar kinase/adenylyltransferase)
LQEALRRLPGVKLDYFLATAERRTFTYTKPLIIRPNLAPEELNRLDIKNWLPTSAKISAHFCSAVRELASRVDAFMLLEQVDIPDTGVLTQTLLAEIGRISQTQSKLLILGDSRRGLKHFPPISFKMNAAELKQLLQVSGSMDIAESKRNAIVLSQRNQKPVFVTMAERGIVGAEPTGQAFHVTSLPLRGEIDIVGAGDAVSANLVSALAAGANVQEAAAMANLAASVVIHQLGTTGSASVDQIAALLTE